MTQTRTSNVSNSPTAEEELAGAVMTQPRTLNFSNMAVHSDKGCGIDVEQQHMPTPSAG